MANLKEWILEVAENEKIEAVVIGRSDYEGRVLIPNYNQIPKGKLLSWKEAIKYLDYEFDDGLGIIGCNAIYAWTASKIISIGTYDGETWPYSLPRHPIDVMPKMEEGSEEVWETD